MANGSAENMRCICLFVNIGIPQFFPAHCDSRHSTKRTTARPRFYGDTTAEVGLGCWRRIFYCKVSLVLNLVNISIDDESGHMFQKENVSYSIYHRFYEKRFVRHTTLEI